ncbi:MAG: hypothetical protein AAF632_20650 [Bacteroidota bacterium]
MRKLITVTITGDITFANAIIEGDGFRLLPVDGNQWKGKHFVNIEAPLVEIRSIVKGAYLAKYKVVTTINGIPQDYDGLVKSSDRFTYAGKDFLLSDFNI